MKLFTVTLVATLLCATIVSAAPSPSPTNTLHDLALFDDESFDSIDIITKFINAMIEKTKCVLDVFGNLIGEGKLKNIYKKFRTDVEAILKNDATKCMKTKGFIEKMKCALTVKQKLNTLYGNFIREVIKTKTDIAGKMMKALYECAKKEAPTVSVSFESPIGDELVAFDDESFGLIDILTKFFNSMIEKTKCTWDVFGKLIGEGKLRNIYKKFRKDVEALYKSDVKKCMETEGVIERIKCALTFNQKLNTLYANFFKAAFKANKQIGEKLVKALYKCSKVESPFNDKAFVELPIEDESVFGAVDVIEKILNYIKCFVDAISKAVNDTDLAPAWEATKNDIDAMLIRLNACRNGENKVDEIRCTISEMRGIIPIIKNALSSLKKAHRDVHDRINENVKKCRKF